MIGFIPEKLNNLVAGPAPLGFSWEKGIDPTGHPIYQLVAGPFAKRITRSLKDIALLLASQMYNLIIDDVAFGAIQVEEWREVFKDYKVLYVGVITPLHILEDRERTRGDRVLGSARGQYYQVHENVSYDIEVDTHSCSVEENVKKIQMALKMKN